MTSEILPIRLWYQGRSLPLWKYDSVPEKMRPARTTDLYMGRPVLYQVLTGPDEGQYYSDYVRPNIYQLLIDRINAGKEVYVAVG